MKKDPNLKKAGAIELMRFLFAFMVLGFHIKNDLWGSKSVIGKIGGFQFTFFRNGMIGVEFFFLVSGYLMAKSIYHTICAGVGERSETGCRTDRQDISIGTETIAFLWKKLRQVYVYYIPACLVMLLGLIFLHYDVGEIIDRIPSLFPPLQMSGAFSSIGLCGAASWYIGSMFIALAVIFPLCRKYYMTYVTLIAPLAGIIIIGALTYSTGQLGGASQWILFTYKANYRAIAEIGLGATGFEISRRIAGYAFTKLQSIMASGLALICYGLVIIFGISTWDRKYQALCVYLLMVAVTISFSGVGFLSKCGVFQTSLVMWLGRLSLPLYLFQNVARNAVPVIMKHASKGKQSAAILLGSLIIGIAAERMVHIYGSRKRNQRI